MFLDTNIFLRHLLRDDPIRSTAARDLFHAIGRDEIMAWTSPLVIAEIVFVLSNPKTYALSRAQIRDGVLPLIGLSGVALERKRLYPRAFALFVSLPIDFVDAFHAARIEDRGENTLYSYDTDFDGIPGIHRQEP